MDLEHVEPVQSLTRDRRSRTRGRMAVAIPVALLLGVIAFGVLGRAAPAPPEQPDVALVPQPVTPEPAPPSSIAEPIVEPPELDDDGFPVTTIGLHVLGVDETLRALARDELGSGLVAVSGWLSIPSLHRCTGSTDAAGAGEWDVLCQRTTYLTRDAEPIFMVEQGGIRPLELPDERLEPQAMPGIELESIAGGQFHGYEGPLRPRPVVLAGRFGDARLVECRSRGGTDPRCATAFAIERVIWLDGEPQVRRSQRYPGLVDAELSRLVRWPILDSATQRGSIVLSELLVPRGALARLDPVADRSVPDDVTGPVWYIRTQLRSGPYGRPTGDVGWAVIEDATATVLAADPDGRSASAE
jgi:hypothetical protein